MSEIEFSKYEASVEVRVDSHYTNQVVSLGTITELFGMAGTKLAYMFDGDAGFMRAMNNVEFIAPAYQGDFLRVTAKLVGVGNSSRKRVYECWCTARTYGVGDFESSGDVLAKPILIARADGVAVTPVQYQRCTPRASAAKK
ncbi:hotdog domain-containing protein [Bradyrhizobium sp. DASA03007]|uniref:hotdog domain-containing protein n=1 Tax=unclassified Bradyrhizobium TaxID=2631580 RepID=UPI003F72F935